MRDQSATTPAMQVIPGVYAPGHLGELTQIVDFALVDAVLEETGAREKRLRLLPARVMVYFVLALALFEHASYRAVWGKLTAHLPAAVIVRPAVSSLARARRRLGARPLKVLFETLAGPVGERHRPGSFYRGLRTVAVDGTSLHVPEDAQVTWLYPKRVGEKREFGYPLLRLLVIVECGTRALLGAAFGPEATGELPYATRLLHVLDASMLLLADAGFDAVHFLADTAATGAHFLVRSGASRCPTALQHLADGSYLARLRAPYRAGLGYSPLPVRVIEAEVTVTLSDGTVRTEQWRLLTSLLDHTTHPASELLHLYHERWQAETAYFSIKASILDGRVLRSRSIDGLDQEVWALLTAYQVLIRAAADAITDQPALDMDRLSFTVLLQAAADTVLTAAGTTIQDKADLVGRIGAAILADLWPAHRRQRVKARSKKNTTSKYAPNAGKHPQSAPTYTFSAKIGMLENGLTARPRR
ncbi:IS4 family transposase [Streptacidiphilus sp. PAMC 29251]